MMHSKKFEEFKKWMEKKHNVQGEEVEEAYLRSQMTTERFAYTVQLEYWKKEILGEATKEENGRLDMCPEGR